MVVLDKTGTLTYGQPVVQAVLPADGVDPNLLLDTAASAELRSEHPLGKTIVTYVRGLGRPSKSLRTLVTTPGSASTPSSEMRELLSATKAACEPTESARRRSYSPLTGGPPKSLWHVMEDSLERLGSPTWRVRRRRER
jgi:cation transport ATPase